MFLNSLEILGFKSFADKINIKFPYPGITVIVGPNGAGKSNICDALRWVLGEQSLKIIRCKKSEDIIFSGSKSKAPLGKAEVKATFFNSKTNEEITISRKFYRSGENEYYINQNPVRLLDIQIWSAENGISPSSYSIINQGMLNEIIEAIPNKRKDFFDSATGVKVFQIKKHKAKLKLENSLNKLENLNLLIQEVEPHLKYLKKQVRKYLKKEEYEKKLKIYQKKYYSTILNNLNNKISENKNQFLEIESQLKEQKKKIDKIKKEILKLSEITLDDENFRKNQEFLENIRNKKELLLVQKTELKHMLKNDYEERGDIDKSMLINKLEEIEKQIRENLLEEKNINLNLEELKNQKKFLEKRLNNILKYPKKISEDFLFNKIIAIKENLSLIKKNLENKNKALKLLRNTIKIISDLLKYKEFLKEYRTIGKLKEELSQLNFKIENLNNKQKYILNQKQFLEKQHKEIKEKISQPKEKNLISRLEIINKELSNLVMKEQTIRKILKNYQSKMLERRNEILKLQEKLEKETKQEIRLSEFLNSFKIDIAKLETKKENLLKEIQKENVTIDNSLIVNDFELEKLEKQIQIYKNKVFSIGEIDEEILSEYETQTKRYNFLKNQILDIKNTIDNLKNIIKELEQRIEKEFMEKFKILRENFSYYYKLITKGKADLILKNDGIEILATPSGKKIKDVNILSGGEKALVSIALLCGILKISKSSFVLLDEIDAALDEINSNKIVKILQDFSNNLQIIIISHNRVTMQSANILYGVSMLKNGVSKIYSLKL